MLKTIVSLSAIALLSACSATYSPNVSLQEMENEYNKIKVEEVENEHVEELVFVQCTKVKGFIGYNLDCIYGNYYFSEDKGIQVSSNQTIEYIESIEKTFDKNDNLISETINKNQYKNGFSLNAEINNNTLSYNFKNNNLLNMETKDGVDLPSGRSFSTEKRDLEKNTPSIMASNESGLFLIWK